MNYERHFTDATINQKTSHRIYLSGYTKLDMAGKLRKTFTEFCLDGPVMDRAKALLLELHDGSVSELCLKFNSSGYMDDIEVIKR